MSTKKYYKHYEKKRFQQQGTTGKIFKGTRNFPCINKMIQKTKFQKNDSRQAASNKEKNDHKNN